MIVLDERTHRDNRPRQAGGWPRSVAGRLQDSRLGRLGGLSQRLEVDLGRRRHRHPLGSCRVRAGTGAVATGADVAVPFLRYPDTVGTAGIGGVVGGRGHADALPNSPWGGGVCPARCCAVLCCEPVSQREVPPSGARRGRHGKGRPDVSVIFSFRPTPPEPHIFTLKIRRLPAAGGVPCVFHLPQSDTSVNCVHRLVKCTLYCCVIEELTRCVGVEAMIPEQAAAELTPGNQRPGAMHHCCPQPPQACAQRRASLNPCRGGRSHAKAIP